jgi:hypothetical protein
MELNGLSECLQRMMAGFEEDLATMRASGASQQEIEAMLDRFERIYAPSGDAEGKLVMDVLRKAARAPR